jgi:hypothetical protein
MVSCLDGRRRHVVAWFVEALRYMPWNLILPAALGPRFYSASNRNDYQKQKKCFWGVERSPRLRLTTRWLSRQCGNLSISQPYRAQRPITGKALLYFYVFRLQTRRRTIMNWKAASITHIKLLLISQSLAPLFELRKGQQLSVIRLLCWVSVKTMLNVERIIAHFHNDWTNPWKV